MKSERYDFQWFEPEKRRSLLRVSVGQDGRLRIGKALRQALPRHIRIGFDPKLIILAIADGHGAGIEWPSYGVVSAERLSARITATGLRLPVSFLMHCDAATGYYLGRVAPRRRRTDPSKAPQYDTSQLMVLYQHILDGAVQQLAKSTPLPERKAIAAEAFCAAAAAYTPGCGDLEAYLNARVRDKLRLENRQFFDSYAQQSLEKPLRPAEGGPFCLLDTLADPAASELDALEDQIMEEQFQAGLTAEERTIYRMTKAGFSMPQIEAELGLPGDQILRLGAAIGQKRLRFFNPA